MSNSFISKTIYSIAMQKLCLYSTVSKIVQYFEDFKLLKFIIDNKM